ncbi:MAG: 23S rRNA (pseudouridine(1915)-N(3))-methyltransferase RlmH [Clostridia bacterium]|nr:23S rRNA (pseudouridine(1915)-N(3))-methyltransferase RlmH [Clostridia bacterium]
MTGIVCVGKLREKPYRQMADEYLKRLSRYGTFQEMEVPDLPEPAHSSPAVEEQIREKEGAQILSKISPSDYVIAMTIRGKKRDSEDLARHLSGLRTQGKSRILFVIGGSLGLSPAVVHRAQEELSMSDMTFPHQLARVMLLEQLYRCEKINANERYHK